VDPQATGAATGLEESCPSRPRRSRKRPPIRRRASHAQPSLTQTSAGLQQRSRPPNKAVLAALPSPRIPLQVMTQPGAQGIDQEHNSLEEPDQSASTRPPPPPVGHADAAGVKARRMLPGQDPGKRVLCQVQNGQDRWCRRELGQRSSTALGP